MTASPIELRPTGQPEMAEFTPVALAGRNAGGGWRWAALLLSVLVAGIGSAALLTPDGRHAGPPPAALGLAVAPPESAPADSPTVPSRTARVASASPSRSLSLVLPEDDAILHDRLVAVAGYASGRPHAGPAATVVIEVVAGGRQVARAVIPVHSGRFAGTLDLPAGFLDQPFELRLRVPSVSRLVIDREVRLVSVRDLDPATGSQLSRGPR